MGRRGAAPRPTALQLLAGVDKKNPKRINRSEPRPNEDKIAPTSPLDAAGYEVWNRLAPDLERQGVLKPWDCDAFTAYCQAVAKYREAEAGLDRTGVVMTGSTGALVKSPYWQPWREAIAAIISLGGRFGLTPSDRAQLRIGGEKHEPGADLLSG